MEKDEREIEMSIEHESPEIESADKEPYPEDEFDGVPWMNENGITIA